MIGRTTKELFMKSKLLALLVAAVSIGGCSTKQTLGDVQKDYAKAEEVRAQAEEKRMKKRQEQAQEFLEVVPAWAMEAPRPDATGLYAIGASESDSLNVSQKKAMLDAEFGLAKLYKQELSGSERSFTQERNDKSLSTQYTALIDKLVARVPVVGFEVVKQEVKAVRGGYNTWVLLKLPYAQFNKVLQEQKAESMDTAVKDAFDDLDKRVKARIEERQKDAKAQQAMRLEEMKTKSEIVTKEVASIQSVAPVVVVESKVATPSANQ